MDVLWKSGRGCRAISGRPRPLVLGLIWAATVLVSGCAAFVSEPTWHGREASRSWAVITGTRSTGLGPGVELELPDAPYRLWFSDNEGQFFRASRPLVFKNSHGLAVAREGGLYIRNSEPDHGLVWLLPLLGRPLSPNAPHWRFEVKTHVQAR